MKQYESYAQSSDPKLLIKQLSIHSAALKQCKRQKPGNQARNEGACMLNAQAAAFYKGRLNEIATGVPDEDTQPWLTTLHSLDTAAGEEIGILDRQLAATSNAIKDCRSQAISAGSQGNLSRWSGQYTNGPYKIGVSGGASSISFDWARRDGIGTCCPLTDIGGGNCGRIRNDVATRCTWQSTYQDDAKTVVRSGAGSISVSGDTISIHLLTVKAAGTLADGKPCAPINECTSMHPGATWDAYWERNKS